MTTKPMEILALIPARSGSKRVKNKNIRLLGGKPLLAYTIAAAKKAKLVTRVILSTDSEEIALLGKQFGAEAPFLRPAAIAQDHSTEFEFHQHAHEWLREQENYEPALIVNLYPTSPFRKPESIDAAITSMTNHPEADSLRSIRKVSEHPYKMWIREGEYLQPFVKKEDSNTHTLSYQLLPEVYIQNASIYITRPRTLRDYHSTVGEKVLSFLMDEVESVDVNHELDFLLAEALLRDKKYPKKP